MHHVNAERGVVLEHPADLANDVRAGSSVVGLAPTVEPAGVILPAHERPLGANGAQRLEITLRVAAEIHHAEQIRAGVILKLRRAIAREQRHFKPRFLEVVSQHTDVIPIVSVRAILIFDLDHDDGAAASGLKGCQLPADGPEILPARLQIPRIASA